MWRAFRNDRCGSAERLPIRMTRSSAWCMALQSLRTIFRRQGLGGKGDDLCTIRHGADGSVTTEVHPDYVKLLDGNAASRPARVEMKARGTNARSREALSKGQLHLPTRRPT